MNNKRMAARVTFHGFVATTVDAAYLVEAAALAHDLPLVDSALSAADLGIPIQSGTVVVYRTQRWKDGRKWTDRRSLGNGFSVHREVSKDEAGRLTRAEIADEHARHGELIPYLGSHVGREGCKSGGLIRKTIRFTLGGRDWGLAAYYTIADVVIGNNLVRPRSDPAVAELLLSRGGLDREFWQQSVPGGPPRHTAVTMVDDNNAGAVADWHLWYRPPKVKSPPPLEARPAASPEDRGSTIAESVHPEEEEAEEGEPPFADFSADYFDLDAFLPAPDAMDDDGDNNDMDNLLAEMVDEWNQQQQAQQAQQSTAHQDHSLGLVPGQPDHDDGFWDQLMQAGGGDVAPVADPAAVDQNGGDAATALLPQDLEGLSAFLDRLIESGEVVLPGAV